MLLDGRQGIRMKREILIVFLALWLVLTTVSLSVMLSIFYVQPYLHYIGSGMTWYWLWKLSSSVFALCDVIAMFVVCYFVISGLLKMK